MLTVGPTKFRNQINNMKLNQLCVLLSVSLSGKLVAKKATEHSLADVENK